MGARCARGAGSALLRTSTAPRASSRAMVCDTAFTSSPVAAAMSASLLLPSTRDKTNASAGPIGSALTSTPSTSLGRRFSAVATRSLLIAPRDLGTSL
jgi:hypothetical protein